MPDTEGLDEIAASKVLNEYFEKLHTLGFVIELDITMKDGSEITAEADSRLFGASNASNSNGTVNCLYMKDGLKIAIDPDEIVSITAKTKTLSE